MSGGLALKRGDRVTFSGDFTIRRRGRAVTIIAPRVGWTLPLYVRARVVPLTLTPDVLAVLRRSIQRRLTDGVTA